MSNSRNLSSYPTVSCYFCNQSFSGRFFQEHLQLCGAVLEECPEKCGAYIDRRNLKYHIRQCTKFHIESKSLPHKFRMEPKNKEINWQDNVFSILSLLRTAVKDGENERKQLMESSLKTMRRLEEIENVTKNIRLTVLGDSEAARQRFISDDKKFKNVDRILEDVEVKTRSSFDAVAYRLDVIQGGMIDERNKQLKKSAELENEMKELKTFVAKESILISDIWDEHKRLMNDLKLELEMRCKNANDMESKYDILSEKIEILVEGLRNHSECIIKQEKATKVVKSQIKDTIKCLEDLVIKETSNQNSYGCQCSSDMMMNGVTRGRLLWRIDRYKEKMNAAQDKNLILYSPVFFNKEYGYALQMELYLNGRDRWKDRNIIGCLKVVEGPWDPLLDWPCILRATVMLRDQNNPANNIRKIVKTRANVKDNDDNSSSTDSAIDMFIPHTILTRHDGFTKNNLLFLDIQVTELRGSLSTSSLIA